MPKMQKKMLFAGGRFQKLIKNSLRVLKKCFLLSLRSSYGAVAILIYDGSEITTSFCFRKTPHDDIL